VTILSVLLALTVGFASCGANRTTGETAPLGQTIKLKVKQAVEVREAAIRVSFDEVVDDSRCPEGVTCVWAGNGKIKLTVMRTGSEARVIELNTNLKPRVVSFEGYEIKLEQLDPYPRVNGKTPPDSYVATISVHRT
jgi:hypothetical protein